jgi:hypothetical protein
MDVAAHLLASVGLFIILSMLIPPVERKRQIMAAAIPKAPMNADSKNSMPDLPIRKGQLGEYFCRLERLVYRPAAICGVGSNTSA